MRAASLIVAVTAMRLASVGQAVFAATMVAVGILGLVQHDLAPIWQGVPRHFAGREILVYPCAFVSLTCGLGLLWPRGAGTAARVLFAYLLLWMLLFKVPYIVHAPRVEGYYESCGESAVLVAGAWVLYVRLAPEWDRRRLSFATGGMGLRLARALYGLSLLAFGLSHFVYLDLTAPLVPGWLPWHLAWAYFTGCAYAGAGAAVLTGVCARLAATLSTLQMGLFTLLVWVPLAAQGLITNGQRGELALSWALTAAAWAVADSYRGMPWLAARTRAGADVATARAEP